MTLLKQLRIEDFRRQGNLKWKLVPVASLIGLQEPQRGWILCNGFTFLRTDVAPVSGLPLASLYDYLGSADGAAGKLPDFRDGVTPVAKGPTYLTAEGGTGGERTHILTSGEIPSHAHNVFFWTYDGGNSGSSSVHNAAVTCFNQYSYHGGYVTWNGENPWDAYGAAHENMHPFSVISAMLIRIV